MATNDEKPEALDEDDEARKFILARRARFVAAALAGAGIATAACGGESRELDDPHPVQSGGTTSSGGRPPVSSGGTRGDGGRVGAGGAGGKVGAGGFNVCLSAPTGGVYGTGGYGFSGGIGAGGVPPAVDAGDSHDAGDAATSTGGITGAGGLPQPCLSIPQAPPASRKK